MAYLHDRLLTAEPAELLVIRAGAAAVPRRIGGRNVADRRGFGGGQGPPLPRRSAPWRRLTRHLHAGQTAGKPAAEALVAENPLVAGAWVEALRPVRQSLCPGFRRSSATTSAATRSGRWRPASWPITPPTDREVLADLVMDADEKQFAVIYPKLKERGEEGLPLVARRNREAIARHQRGSEGSLGEAAGECGGRPLEDEPCLTEVWPLLKHSPDPRVRSYLIHSFAPLGVDVTALVRRLGRRTGRIESAGLDLVPGRVRHDTVSSSRATTTDRQTARSLPQ